MSRTCWYRALLSSVLLLFGGIHASARTYVLTPDGGGDFPTIRAAMNAASDGDTILLENGIFSGRGNRNISFLGKAVMIRSRSGPDSCRIDCGGYQGFLFDSLEGPGSILEGIGVTGGAAPIGGAIQIVNGSRPTIRHCLFEANFATNQGGAIYCREASAWVSDCRFLKNHSDLWGGAIVCAQTDTVVVCDCVFEDNTAAYEGGAVASYGSPWQVCLLLKSCIFKENQSGLTGGAVVTSGEDCLESCLFEGNRSKTGGAVRVARDCGHGWDGKGRVETESEGLEDRDQLAQARSWPTPDLVACTFYRNSADSIGGAICSSSGYDCYPYLIRCTVLENEAPEGSGLYNSGLSGWPIIENCVFAFGGGTAIGVQLLVPRLSCCDVFGNSAGDWTGPIAPQRYVRDNFWADPLFCGDSQPSAPYMLSPNSPCAWENNPACGQVGAWWVGCPDPQEADQRPAEEKWSSMILARPNPFASGTRIVFRVPGVPAGPGPQIMIHDAAGRHVRSLAPHWDGGGMGWVEWDGRDDSGRESGSGLYFAVIPGWPGKCQRLALLR